MVIMKEISALGGGKLYIPSLTTAYLPPNANEYNFFLQSRCYIYADGQTAAAALKLRAEYDLQVTEWTIYPDVNGVAYIPLNDLLAYRFVRKSNDAIGLVGAQGTIDITSVDGNGVTIDSVGIIANIYDCAGIRGGYSASGFDHLLPDTFRVPLSLAYNEYINVGCRLTHGVNLVLLNSGGSDYQYWQKDSGGEAVGVNLKLKGHPAYLRAYEDSVSPDPAALVGEALFDLVDCLDDKLVLTWWSMEDGFYKSRVADVVGGGSNQLNAIDYIHDFENRTAKDADTYVSARFASLSQRDYEYYRDLLTSDEVWIIAPVNTAEDTAEITRVPVKIDGTIPRGKTVGRTDIEFDVIYNKYSEL